MYKRKSKKRMKMDWRTAKKKKKKNKKNYNSAQHFVCCWFFYNGLLLLPWCCVTALSGKIYQVSYKKKGELNGGQIRGGSISPNRSNLMIKLEKRKKVKTRYKYESRRKCTPNEYQRGNIYCDTYMVLLNNSVINYYFLVRYCLLLQHISSQHVGSCWWDRLGFILFGLLSKTNKNPYKAATKRLLFFFLYIFDIHLLLSL